jgi:predicted nucleic acid-binding protein
VPGYCSVITEAELWAGRRGQQVELEAAAALSLFNVIEVDRNIARLAGDLLNRKSAGERKAHFRDALIAATAIQQGETVLTADAASQRVFEDSVNYLVYR